MTDKPRPTPSELEILRVLWRRGPSTVRQVHVSLPDNPTAYTTTLKLMQIMSEKGLVTRNESAKTHVYTPAVDESLTQRRLLSDLIERAFGGSAKKLMVAALSHKKASRQDLAEIRELIAQLERSAK